MNKKIKMPKEIKAKKYVLKPIPATVRSAKQVFDIFHEDVDGFKYWMEYGLYKNTDEVLQELKTKNKDKGFCKYAMYGIFRGDELLGEIGLGCIYVRRQSAEVGFWLKKSARGCGIIDALLPVIEKLGFETYDLHKLSIWCDNENKPVKKIAKNHGYTWEGLLREEKIWPDGSPHSTVLYGKLKSEWLKQNKRKKNKEII